jgi:hypothetical protein
MVLGKDERGRFFWQHWALGQSSSRIGLRQVLPESHEVQRICQDWSNCSILHGQSQSVYLLDPHCLRKSAFELQSGNE